MEIEEKDGFTWEGAYEKTWESIREDESGSIRTSVLDAVHEAKRKRLLARQKNVRLGIMRHAFLVVDMSECMLDKDYQPTRIQLAIQMLKAFVDEFFDQNPISQLGIIVTRDKKAELVLGLTGNFRAHETALKKMQDMMCSGETSLQNALSMAHHILRHTPAHSSREVLYLVGSLSTCDPGNIVSTIDKLCADRVRCSVVALAAEVRVLRLLADKTGGQSWVVLDEIHLKELLFGFSLPTCSGEAAESSMVRMAFPTHRQCTNAPSLCACHAEDAVPSASGYFCPQCNAKYCSLPVQCRLCRLTLVSAPQLARTYQHLAPLAPFTERPVADGTNSLCYACARVLQGRLYVCAACDNEFCIDCDLLLHESIHLCPACQS